jgi:hypothetical protein
LDALITSDKVTAMNNLRSKLCERTTIHKENAARIMQ